MKLYWIDEEKFRLIFNNIISNDKQYTTVHDKFYKNNILYFTKYSQKLGNYQPRNISSFQFIQFEQWSEILLKSRFSYTSKDVKLTRSQALEKSNCRVPKGDASVSKRTVWVRVCNRDILSNYAYRMTRYVAVDGGRR